MRSEEYLIKLFMFDPKGKNNDIYLLRYEYRKQQHKDDLLVLKKLMAKGLVRVREKDKKYVTYQYYPTKEGLNKRFNQ